MSSGEQSANPGANFPVPMDVGNSTQNANTSAEDELTQTAGSSNGNDNPQRYGCNHYVRRCAFVSPCCNKVYTCRICHDDGEDHSLDRFAVNEIICLLCDTKQAVARCCTSCGIEFGKYFCEICRLYDDTDKRQFHCNDCGVCRLHGRKNFFHCATCDTCLHKDMKGKHRCIEKVAHGRCSVCLDDLHSSRESLRVLECGHLLHRKCFKGLLRSRIFNCPVCCRTMIDRQAAWRRYNDEIAHTPMPNEYRNMSVRIHCSDCSQSSLVAFHVVGLRCPLCGSFNTSRDGATRPPTAR